MRIILSVLAMAAFAYGAAIMTVAQSAIHEIEASILFLIGAVLLSGGAIVEAVHVMHKKLGESLSQRKVG